MVGYTTRTLFLGFPMTSVLARLLTVFHFVVLVVLALMLGGVLLGFPTARGADLFGAAVLGVFFFFSAVFDKGMREVIGRSLTQHPALSTVSFVWADLAVATGCVLLATGGIPLPDWFGRTPGIFEFLYPSLVIALYAALPVLALFASWYALLWVARGGAR